jgi:hypothetical protein
MTRLPPRIDLGPEEEARRLWRGALEAHASAGESLVSLCECLDLGLRAAEIVVIQRLQAAKGRFPATISLLLEVPALEVEAYRDAVTVPKALGFTDALDLLSESGLECVAPRLHRGWDDRRVACDSARQTARQAVSVTLADADRGKLLLLSAYRNRVFRYPPPLRLVPGEILDAFSALTRLVERLLSPGNERGT